MGLFSNQDQKTMFGIVLSLGYDLPMSWSLNAGQCGDKVSGGFLGPNMQIRASARSIASYSIKFDVG